MKYWSKLLSLVIAALVAVAVLAGAEEPAHVRGADEPFWVPTLEQAIEMARATGRPLFLMGFSLVTDGTTYTKSGEEFCTSVF